MARITVEDCLVKENNRFSLVQLAAKRAKQLLHGGRAVTDAKGNKAVVTALREIADGKVAFMTEEEARIAREQAALEKERAAAEEQTAPPILEKPRFARVISDPVDTDDEVGAGDEEDSIDDEEEEDDEEEGDEDEEAPGKEETDAL